MATPSIDQSSMSSLVPLVSLDHQAHSKQTASGKGTDALRKRSLLPRRLRAVWPDTLLVLAADLGSAVLSLLFFAFGIAVYFYDGTDANEQFAGGRNISETLFNVSRIVRYDTLLLRLYAKCAVGRDHLHVRLRGGCRPCRQGSAALAARSWRAIGNTR